MWLIRVSLPVCSAKERVEMPKYHFIDHRIEIVSHDKDYQKVKVYEIAEAKYSPLPESKAKWRLQRKAKTTTIKEAFIQDYYIALALEQFAGFGIS